MKKIGLKLDDLQDDAIVSRDIEKCHKSTVTGEKPDRKTKIKGGDPELSTGSRGQLTFGPLISRHGLSKNTTKNSKSLENTNQLRNWSASGMILHQTQSLTLVDL